MKYATTWLLLAILITVGIGRLNWPTYRCMASRGISSTATVLELFPQAHNTVRYRYEVGGQTFEGQMQSWQPNAPIEQLGVGRSVFITYDPQHPAVSVLGDPKPMLWNETISIALAALLFPTLIVGGWVYRKKRPNALDVTS
jgi:Protein of unknown function (DUF3592)